MLGRFGYFDCECCRPDYIPYSRYHDDDRLAPYAVGTGTDQGKNAGRIYDNSDYFDFSCIQATVTPLLADEKNIWQ